jgi:acetyltransferase-like isoleucine patch superfamily enzyme
MVRFIQPLYLLVTICGQFVAGLICGLALVPSVWLVSGVWRFIRGDLGSLWHLLLVSSALGLGYFLYSGSLLIVIVLIRNLFHLKNQEGRSLIFSVRIFKYAIYSFLLALARHFVLPFVRSTPVINLFYRGMGAKIGENVLIGTERIWDCDLIEIGNDCVIGGNVAINAHIGQGQKGRLRRVKIGNRVTIGANTFVMPGVVIEDDVLVGPNSVIPMGKRLKAHEVYWGIPVDKITNSRDSSSGDC